MSAYYAAPEGAPSAATEQGQLAPVLVAFSGPARQSRVTVLFRLLMVIPHAIVLYALGIAAEVVVIIGWFAALFTGRLPDFAADYVTGYLRWQTRVFGYELLLTDVYPPFALEDADYPVRLAVRPGRLNRLAVLFRLFLLIPAVIVQVILVYGAYTVVMFVTWLIVLISGQMPGALYQALAATLRYQTRISGFAFMLTSTYPWGLYGDAVAAEAPGFAGEYGTPGGQGYGYGEQAEHEGQPEHESQPTGGLQPGSGPEPAPEDHAGHEAQAEGQQPTGPGDQSGSGPLVGSGTLPAYGAYAQPETGAYDTYPEYGVPAADGYGAPAAGPASAPWQLVLSATAKRLVTGFIALGVLFIVGLVLILSFATSSVVTAAEARHQLQTDVIPASNAINNYPASAQACGNSLPCATSLDRRVAATLNTFADQVRGIAMPSHQASAEAATLADSAAHVASIFAGLGAATSASQYVAIANSSGLGQAVSQLNQDYLNLRNTLSGS